MAPPSFLFSTLNPGRRRFDCFALTAALPGAACTAGTREKHTTGTKLQQQNTANIANRGVWGKVGGRGPTSECATPTPTTLEINGQHGTARRHTYNGLRFPQAKQLRGEGQASSGWPWRRRRQTGHQLHDSHRRRQRTASPPPCRNIKGKGNDSVGFPTLRSPPPPPPLRSRCYKGRVVFPRKVFLKRSNLAPISVSAVVKPQTCASC